MPASAIRFCHIPSSRKPPGGRNHRGSDYIAIIDDIID
jgi:hypothetical protein